MNVHNRIRLAYGKNYGLKINAKEARGTIVGMKLPLGQAPGYRKQWFS
ncbi:hypothetical protein N0M98_09750 [Paenibacillus doosanensis]|nr:hypothetical protein [Paenibacillus konkukensis]MCS7460424.1 hypothetical protein [Paenibacillus doosanensis]